MYTTKPARICITSPLNSPIPALKSMLRSRLIAATIINPDASDCIPVTNIECVPKSPILRCKITYKVKLCTIADTLVAIARPLIPQKRDKIKFKTIFRIIAPIDVTVVVFVFLYA